MIVTLLTVVFSELLPKALTLRYVPTVAAFTAVPVVGVLVAARPLVCLMNRMADLVTRPLGLGSVTEMEREWHTAEKIRQIASQAAEQGALTPQEQALVLNRLAPGKRRARQIMVPRTKVLYLDLCRPTFEVPGDAPLHEVSARLRLPERHGAVATLSGLIVAKLGRVPIPGSSSTSKASD